MNKESNRTIGYGRVAFADERALDRQVQALGEVDLLFAETASGSETEERPALEQMLGQLRKGDVVRVVSADRLARSPRALLDALERIDASGARIEVVDHPDVDPGTPESRGWLTMLAAASVEPPFRTR